MTKEDSKLDAQHEGEFSTDSDGESVMENENDESQGYTVPISELRKVRSEAAKYRRRLRQLENEYGKEQEAAENAKTEELESLRALVEESEAKAEVFKRSAEALAKRAAVINAASIVGFHNPEDAASMIDPEQVEIDVDGTVKLEDLNEMVRLLAESKPYLVKQQSNSFRFGPTNTPSDKWPKPKLRTKDRISNMKRDSVEAMKKGRVTEAIKLYNQAWENERGIKRKG